MRLSLLPPERLSPEQRALYDEVEAGVAAHLQGFVSKRADGALVGPFNPMLHFPKLGRPLWDYVKALMDRPTLPKLAREVAILAVGATFRSRYELYAHEHVNENVGLAAAKVATIAAGERPADLTRDEGVAYDVAALLSRGGPLPGATYQAAVDAFGEEGAAELAYLIGGYCLVSVLLNAYDVSVPGSEEGLG